MKTYSLCLFLSLTLLVEPVTAQDEQGPFLSEETLPQGLGHWKYQPGDNPAWARPDFDDSAWEILPDASFEPEQFPTSGWNGIGWFRLRFTVDSTLWGRPLAFAIRMEGAAEVYLDGVLHTTYGTVGTSQADEVSIRSSYPRPVLREVVFDRQADHVVAVRQSNFVAEDFYKVGGPMGGFDLVVGAPTVLAADISADVRAYTATQYAFTSIFLAFAVLFFILFAFYTEHRNHVYFALLALGVAAMTFLDLQLEMTTTVEQYRFIRRYFALITVFTITALLYFVYALFYKAMPRQMWIFLAATVGIGVWAWLDPFNTSSTFQFLGLILLLEVFRTVATAIWRKTSGAWIVGVGLLFSIAGTGYDLLMDLGLIPEFGEINNGYYYGFVGLLMAMAVYLSREFARTNRDLKEQIVQVKALSAKTLEQERQRLHLEAENKHNALELEKAKALEESYRALKEAHRHLKSTQGQLIHAEKMASLGQLTAGIAHEIKNPLNFVNNFAQLSAELADELREALDANPDRTLADVTDDLGEILDDLKLNAQKIHEHGQRADGIVESMLEHARPAAGRRERTDVNALLDEYIDLCYYGLCTEQDDFPITFERDYDEAVGKMEVMPQEIGRVFFNLLNNAFYAVQEKEQVASEAYLPRISVSTRMRNGTVEIRVGDNGPGIPDALRGKIFEPFYTTKPTGTGTGLGLSISYDIVTQGHGGTLAVESEAGEGATFVVTLPNA